MILAVLGSMRREPRRRDLTRWSWGLVAGVIAQVLLGALLVKTELDPRFTMGHFLLSMVLLWNAVILDEKAREGSSSSPPMSTAARRPQGNPRRLMQAVFFAGACLLVTGTVVTGAGPHAGDTRAERLPYLVREVTRVHSSVAIALLLLVLITWSAPSVAARGAWLRADRRSPSHTGVAGLRAVLYRRARAARGSPRRARLDHLDRDRARHPQRDLATRDQLRRFLARRSHRRGRHIIMTAPMTAPVDERELSDDTTLAPDRPWKVIVWNDPINLMSYVAFVFQKLFGFSKEKANRLMMQVHTEGKAVVASGTKERAELDVFRLHEFGLWATMEQDT